MKLPFDVFFFKKWNSTLKHPLFCLLNFLQIICQFFYCNWDTNDHKSQESSQYPHDLYAPLSLMYFLCIDINIGACEYLKACPFILYEHRPTYNYYQHMLIYWYSIVWQNILLRVIFSDCIINKPYIRYTYSIKLLKTYKILTFHNRKFFT